MTLPRDEIDQVRRIHLEVLSEIEQMSASHGTYRYIVYVAGGLALAHKPVGRVIRVLS